MTVDLSLSAEQEAVAELFGAFLQRESPPAVARAAEPLGFDRALWSRLGPTGAHDLGRDADLPTLAVAAEAFGRAIAPVPFVEHAVASRLVDVDVDGGEVATVALRPADRDGTWRLVPAGAVADVVVGIDGDEAVAVRAAPPGQAPRNHAAAPLADRSARDGTRVVIGPAAAFGTALDEWRVLIAAALTGIAARSLELAVAYVLERRQFGVPVGSFQSVQHGLASLPGMIDGARLLTHKAAWAAGRSRADATVDPDRNDVSDPAALAAMAFVFASDVAAEATDRCLHYHGGYGFAEEYDVQLYYRRARGWALVLDDPSRETRRLADVLF